jgi:hypothetical protein
VTLAEEHSNTTSVYTSVVIVVVADEVAVVAADDVAVVDAVLAAVVVAVLVAVLLAVLVAVEDAVLVAVVDADDTSQLPVVEKASGSDMYAASTLLMLATANRQVLASGATANPLLHWKMSSELPTGVTPPPPYGPDAIRVINARTASTFGSPFASQLSCGK